MVKHVTTYKKTVTSCLKRKYVTRRSHSLSKNNPKKSNVVNSEKNVKKRRICKELENHSVDRVANGTKKSRIKGNYVSRKPVVHHSKHNSKNGGFITNGNVKNAVCNGSDDTIVNTTPITATKNKVNRKYVTRTSATSTCVLGNVDNFFTNIIKRELPNKSESNVNGFVSSTESKAVNKIKHSTVEGKTTPPTRCEMRNNDNIGSVTGVTRGVLKEFETSTLGNATRRTVNKIKRKYVTRKSLPYSKSNSWKATNSRRELWKEFENKQGRRSINEIKQMNAARRPLLRCNLRSRNGDVAATKINSRQHTDKTKAGIICPVSKVKSPVFRYIKCRTCRVPCDPCIIPYNSESIRKIDISPNLGVKLKKLQLQISDLSLAKSPDDCDVKSDLQTTVASQGNLVDEESSAVDIEVKKFQHEPHSNTSASSLCCQNDVANNHFAGIENDICNSFSIKYVNEYSNFMLHKSAKNTCMHDKVNLKDEDFIGNKEYSCEDEGLGLNCCTEMERKQNTPRLDKPVSFITPNDVSNNNGVNATFEHKKYSNDIDLRLDLNRHDITPSSTDIDENDNDAIECVIEKEDMHRIREKTCIENSSDISDENDYFMGRKSISQEGRKGIVPVSDGCERDSDGEHTENVKKTEILLKLDGSKNVNGMCKGEHKESLKILTEGNCHHCQHNNDDHQSCKCCAFSSDCSRYLDTRKVLDINVSSYYCKEHNLIHCRKHVRLKESKHDSLDLPSYSTSTFNDTEIFNNYIFESTRRLKLLHNRFFHTSMTPPNDNIIQNMLRNIEVDIELFKDDSYFTYKCEWDKCDKKFDNGNKLLAHLKEIHIPPTSDDGVFICLWRKCKFINQPSSSYKWLCKHVLRHCSDRPFKCVISGCESSFATRNGLARHVPSHFNEGKVRRACVLTSTVKSSILENGTRNKIDMNSSPVESSEELDESNEPIKKRSRYEKFVDKYKARDTGFREDQGFINNIKYRLQISTCDSPAKCGYVGHYFRFSHKVIGKRTSTDGSLDMLMSPSSATMFPLKSFWFNARSLEKEKSLYVDINVNNLSDDIKQQLHDNEHSFRLYKKGTRSNRY